MTKTKVLNIVIGKVWDADKKKSMNVTAQAFEKESKAGKKYYELRMPIFVAEIEKKDYNPDPSPTSDIEA